MKAIGRVILSAILLVLTGLMIAFAKAAPSVVFSFYPALSRSILSAISSVSGLMPIALWEVLAVLLALWFFYTLIRVFTGRRSLLCWLSGVLLGLSTGVFLFVAIWGLGHFGPSVDQTLGLDVREYSKQELIAATAYYAAQANEYAEKVERDAENLTVYPAFSELAKQAPGGYAALAQQYDPFTDGLGPVKPLASWRLFSQTGTTGIFICFTAEACVNPDTYTAWIPFTMCHELSHRRCIALERDANFGAYLACRANDSIQFQYSGYFMAYRYCYNALVSAGGSVQAQAISSGETAELTRDLADYRTFFAQKQSAKATKVADKVNDTYIKASGDSSGVASYGEVCDLLVNLYLEEEVKPNMVEPEPTFDPLDKSQVDLGDLVGDWG